MSFNRRLLYVACTRAQGLLYMTFAEKRKVAGDTKAKAISEFISAVVKRNLVTVSLWQQYSMVLTFS